MIVYEDNRTYGAGAEIVAMIAEEAMFDLDAPIVRIGGPDVPAMPFATPLEHFFMEPEPDQVYRRMRDLAPPDRSSIRCTRRADSVQHAVDASIQAMKVRPHDPSTARRERPSAGMT